MNTNTTKRNDFVLATIRQSQELATRSKALTAVESVFFLLITSIAFIGNILVFVAIYRAPRLRTATNFLLVGLALSDVFMSVAVMPLTDGVLIQGRDYYGAKACNMQGYLFFYFGYISIFLMALIAVNRYLCVLRADLYHVVFSKRKSALMVLLLWIVTALLFSLLPSFAMSKSFFLPGYAICVMVVTDPAMKIAHIAFDALVIPLCFITMAVCYYRVFKTVKEHNTLVASSVAALQPVEAGNLSVEEVRLTKTLLTLILGFSLCWIPTLVITAVGRSHPRLLPRQVQLFDTSLIFISSAINPIIYGITNPAFRAEYKKLVLRASVAPG